MAAVWDLVVFHHKLKKRPPDELGLNRTCKNLHFTFQTMSAEMLMGVDRGRQSILICHPRSFWRGSIISVHAWETTYGIPANYPRMTERGPIDLIHRS